MSLNEFWELRLTGLEKQPFGDHDLRHFLQFWEQVHVSRQKLDGVVLADGRAEITIEKLREKLLVLHRTVAFLRKEKTKLRIFLGHFA